ncbi:hypothetical protein [Qipengyuania qiaonensis]|uniref:30S ribosomal protein S14 n=1 Tax=Qipengyuania qiaonensis TaxID=2867240 RepID=A0ABS7J3S4_9SPHN|nr:hypothetical protein [Qipengyuania qiaonensis]MBX7481922.1 hypothetical protein [Qipengyuania qiaonensis]
MDRTNVKRAAGQQVGRCRNCKAPMEEIEPHHWGLQRVKDAGLGPRAFM